jgi:hypothetical protein
MPVRTIKKSSCPDQIELNGTTLKMYAAGSASTRPAQNIAADLKAQGLTVCILEVMNPRLKGKTDLHSQPYKPSQFIFSDLHTEEQINLWRDKVNFWKKQFQPRTKKWMIQTRRKNNTPKNAYLMTGNEQAQNQAIKELLSYPPPYFTAIKINFMTNQHTPGTWQIGNGEFSRQYANGIMSKLPTGEIIHICSISNLLDGKNNTDKWIEAEANANLIAAAPELLQMVYDLKECVKRLSQDNLSQYDRDTEAQQEGEANELLIRINPNYYKNANEKQ